MPRVPPAIACLLLSASWGCSTLPLPSGNGGADAAARDLTAVDQAVRCPQAFPQFDKSCASGADCLMRLHQTDCCGSRVAIGIAAGAAASFDAAEKLCESMYPGCGCAPAPTRAEDGMAERPGHPIVVDCVAGACRTSVP